MGCMVTSIQMLFVDSNEVLTTILLVILVLY